MYRLYFVKGALYFNVIIIKEVQNRKIGKDF